MENILNVLKFDAQQNLQKLRQPVDRDKWSTEPAVVNAFYNPNKNDIGNFHLFGPPHLRFITSFIAFQYFPLEYYSPSSTVNIFQNH